MLNSNQISFPCVKVITKLKSKQHVNGISKWISNRCSHHYVNWKAKFKSQIPSKLKPRISQASYPRGTINSENMYDTFHPSYHLFFVIKAKSYTDAPTRESENIPHRGTLVPCFFSITSLWIYNKEKLDQVKAILCNNSAMDSNSFLFDPVNHKICHKLRVCSSGSLVSMAHKNRK